MIDIKTLESIAAYAKLRMEDGDLEKINDTLAIIDRINDISLDRDEFLRSLSCAPAESAAHRPLSRDDLLRNAPQVEAGCISVPKILGGESQ